MSRFRNKSWALNSWAVFRLKWPGKVQDGEEVGYELELLSRVAGLEGEPSIIS